MFKTILGASLIAMGTHAQAEAVKVDSGTIAGAKGRDPRVLVFKGIPYAAPPVGGLRWKPPQPVQPWTGQKRATTFGPVCIGRSFGPPPPEGMSEDCLFLNVWTPADRSEPKLPVLVWIHGGGFQGGGGSHPSCDGEEFARQGVVVVTFNYRVGVLGFMAHPELTAESGRHASGNYGLLDQVAALQWVQRNISAFGGDPRKVTIAGESAGANSVSALTASPMARGLFRAAIAESGGFLVPKLDAMRTLAASEKIGSEFARLTGSGDLAALRSISAEALIKATEKMPDPFAFQPGVDGDYLVEPVYTTYSKQEQARIPVLIGSNTDEGAFLLPNQRSSLPEFEARLEQTFGANSTLVHDAYPTSTPPMLVRSELDLYGDDAFNYPMWKWARMQEQAGLPAFRYLFGRTIPATAGQTYKGIPRAQIGAFHGDEVAYAFGTLDLAPVSLDGTSRAGRWEEADSALSRTMVTYWANFVKTGDPNGPGAPRWPRYQERTGNPLMHFHNQAEVTLDNRASRMLLLDTAFQPSNRKSATNQGPENANQIRADRR
jgi:para-nitrobenzyl esterase